RTLAVFALLTTAAGYSSIAGDPVTGVRPAPVRPPDEDHSSTLSRRVRTPDDAPTLDPTRGAAQAPSPDTFRIFVSADGSVRTDRGTVDREELHDNLRHHADVQRDLDHRLRVSTRSVLVVAERETTWGPVRRVLQACSHYEVRIWRTWMAIEGRSPVRAFLEPDRLGPTEIRIIPSALFGIGVELLLSEDRNCTMVKFLAAEFGAGEAAFHDLERRIAKIEAADPTIPGLFLASEEVPFRDVLCSFAAFRRGGVEEVRFERVPPRSWAALRAGELEEAGRFAEAIEPWVEALTECCNYAGRKRAADRLVEIGEAAVPALAAEIRRHSSSVRPEAVNTLAKIVSLSSHEAVPALIVGLSDWQTEDEASAALMRMGRAAAPDLVDALATGRARDAAEVLLRMGEDAIPALEWGIIRGQVATRREAIHLLCRIDLPEDAKRTVATALDDPDETVRKIAKAALQRLSGSQVGEQHAHASRGE
ncbi:MAG: hypothetical protein ACYS99_02740, partial [Planctomycetota bacterium]